MPQAPPNRSAWLAACVAAWGLSAAPGRAGEPPPADPAAAPPAEAAPAPPPAAPAAPAEAAAAPPADPLQALKDAILRALARARRGDPPEAVPAGAAPLDRFLAALGVADDEAAWPLFKQLSLDAPKEPWGELGQARIYVRWKLPDQAGAAFDRALRIAPGNPIVLVDRAIGNRAFGYADAARADAEAVLAADPRDARALLVLAWLAEDAGRPKAEVKGAWEQALAQSPELYEARAALAALAESEGNTAAAREGVEALARLSPRDLLLQRRLAALRRAAGDHAGAAAASEAAIALGDGSKETWTALAAARRAQRDFAAEEQALGRLRRIDPKDRTVIVRLFNLRAAAKDAAGMDEQARALLGLDGKDAGAHLALAIHKGEKGDLIGELDELELAAKGTAHPEAKTAPERARAELEALRERLGLPQKPLLAANYDGLYLVASRHLTRLYDAHRKERPELRGKLSIKIRIGNGGGADAVEVTEDTLGDGELTAGLVAALKDGSWPKAQKTLNLKFDLAPPGSRPAPREREPEPIAIRPQPPAPPPPPPKRAASASELAAPSSP